MGQSTPIGTRKRSQLIPLTSEECAERAAGLFATAYEMKPGTARQVVLKEACDYRMLAEMKRIMPAPKRSSPAG